jgi:hypothetical protein
MEQSAIERLAPYGFPRPEIRDSLEDAGKVYCSYRRSCHQLRVMT